MDITAKACNQCLKRIYLLMHLAVSLCVRIYTIQAVRIYTIQAVRIYTIQAVRIYTIQAVQCSMYGMVCVHLI